MVIQEYDHCHISQQFCTLQHHVRGSKHYKYSVPYDGCKPLIGNN